LRYVTDSRAPLSFYDYTVFYTPQTLVAIGAKRITNDILAIRKMAHGNFSANQQLA